MRVTLDVSGQVEGVIANEPFGEFRVPRLEGLDDLHVVDDRALEAMVLTDGAVPDRPHMDEEILGEPLEDVRMCHVDDGLMEGQVRFRVFVDMRAALAILKCREDAPQRRDLVVVGVKCDEPRGHAFERRPGLHDLDDLALALPYDEDAAPRNRAHQTLVLEPRHRLADGRAADSEVRGELALVEPDLVVDVVDVHLRDCLAQRRIGLRFEGEVALERLDDEARGVHRIV